MQLQGIITDGDIRRSAQKFPAAELPSLQARQIMTPNPNTILADTLAVEALNNMEQRSSQISVIPVIDRSTHFWGIVRLHDLIRAGL